MKKPTMLLILILLFSRVCAQQWVIAGPDTIISTRGGMEPFIRIDKLNTPYVAYYDQRAGYGCVVKKFVNNVWVNVGGSVSTDFALNITMDFDNQNRPYVVYRDGSGSKATVKYFDGNNWVTVGNAQFTPTAVSCTSIKIGPGNVPYVAFRDVSQNYSATVMKFDGSAWVYVGQAGFSPQAPASGAYRTSLAIDNNGIIYVAFIDFSNGWRASVMKYDGNNWVFVGSPDISGGPADETCLVIDSQNRPIISYTDGNAQVKRFNGSSWVSIGQTGFAPCDRAFLTIDKSDRLYFAYTNNGMESVMRFNGNNWVQAGNAPFSPTVVVFHPTMAADTSGNLFVAFTDGTDRPWSAGSTSVYNGACVMMLPTTNVITAITEKTTSSFLLNIFPNPSTGMVQINYKPVVENRGILKVTGISGQLIYKEEFYGTYNKEIDFSKYNKGIYFIEIKIDTASEKAKIIIE